MKTGSTKWLRTQGTRCADFHWQNGYGIFPTSPSRRPAVDKQIDGQKEPHQLVTFQDEYRRLLAKYEVEFDERFVFDQDVIG